MDKVSIAEGRALFGSNAEGYDKIRPPYPEELLSVLVAQGALLKGTAALDVGAGNGLATRALIKHGADPILAIEPDRRFASHLLSLVTQSGSRITVMCVPFEAAELEAGSFDLTVAATSYHWLDPSTRVQKLADALKPGGFAALMWNLFQDQTKPDPFHEATQHVLAPLGDTPSESLAPTPFALQREVRTAEFVESGLFEPACYHEVRWTLTLTADDMALLYSTFAHIQKLSDTDREKILTKLKRIANDEFNGKVERHMTSPLYLFRRL